MNILNRIHSREDLLRLSAREESELCSEIRKTLIQNVSDSGGHLASNLGIVELTVAIHKVYDTAVDRLVFDVGHQCYVHKLLTGRSEQFHTLRQFGGISGFPKPEESPHDAFIAGHASNSVSVALGMARARTALGQKHHIIAVLGDGALTGGLAYEGLNDAGASGEPMVIVLNDNGMSIAKNVGGISRHLNLIRVKPGYFALKKHYHSFINTVPGGKRLYAVMHQIKEWLKRHLIGLTLFEEMGLQYLGPVDGHDTEKIAYLLQIAKAYHGPVLLHVITQKGRGYRPAEVAPEDYHGVGHFNPKHGVNHCTGAISFSAEFGRTLQRLAGEDPRICAVTAAMPDGTGLCDFAGAYPNRFFDVGIAEGHAVSMAAGMAKSGLLPVVAIYSTFLQRSFDMLIHDVALQGLHIVFAVDRAGLVGEDGPTHHGVFDVGYLCQIPGMTVLAPADPQELSVMLRKAILELKGPVAIRYPKGSAKTVAPFVSTLPPKVTVVTYGTMIEGVTGAAKLLENQNCGVQVFRLACISPLNVEKVLASAEETGLLVCVEDVNASGCIGQQLGAILSQRRIRAGFLSINLGDGFTPQGDLRHLYEMRGLTSEAIASRILEAIGNERKATSGLASCGKEACGIPQ